MVASSVSTARRWSMLGSPWLRRCAPTCSSTASPSSFPRCTNERGLDLAEAGLMSSLPSFGMVVTLIAWGWVVDRVGERLVLALGSALTAAAAFAAAAADSLVAVGVFLFLGGMAAASSNSASGRLVVGWFPPHQRGADDGHPPDGATIGSGLGRVGDSPAGRARWSRRSRCSSPRSSVRGRRGDQCDRSARPAAPTARRGTRRNTWPTRTEVRRRCGASTRCPCCWSCRSAWSGRSRWCG